MALFSAIAAGIGALVGAVGAGVAAAGAAGLTLGGLAAAGGLAASGYGAYSQYSAGKKQASASRRAEALRKQQAQLELNNKYITTLRESQVARANNLVRGTAQLGSGAQFGSALANTSSSVESALGYQQDVTGQAGSIGFGIFDANAAYSEAGSEKSIASGISNLGAATLGNLGAVERVGSYIGGRMNVASGGAYNPWSYEIT